METADQDDKSQNLSVNINLDGITSSLCNKDDKSDNDMSGNNFNENERLLENIDDIFEKINNNDCFDEMQSHSKKHLSMFNIDHNKIFENVKLITIFSLMRIKSLVLKTKRWLLL